MPIADLPHKLNLNELTPCERIIIIDAVDRTPGREGMDRWKGNRLIRRRANKPHHVCNLLPIGRIEPLIGRLHEDPLALLDKFINHKLEILMGDEHLVVTLDRIIGITERAVLVDQLHVGKFINQDLGCVISRCGIEATDHMVGKIEHGLGPATDIFRFVSSADDGPFDGFSYVCPLLHNT